MCKLLNDRFFFKVCIHEVLDNEKYTDTTSVQSDMPSEKTPLLDISYIDDKAPPMAPPTNKKIASFAKVFGSTKSWVSTISTSVRHLEKSLGFLQGFSLIVGILIGSGVFISPSLVMSHTGKFS